MPHPFLSHSKNISLPCVEYGLRHQSSQYSAEKEACVDYHKLSHQNGSYASSLNKQITPPYGIASSPKNCAKRKGEFNWKKLGVNNDYGIVQANQSGVRRLPVSVSSEKCPRQRSNFAACCDDQNLYIQGGVGHNVSYRDFWKFNFASRVWTEISPSSGMSSGCPLLRDHCMIHYGNRLIIIGGNLVDVEISVPIWCYDLSECLFVDNLPFSSSTYHGNEEYYPCVFGQRSKNSTSAYRLPSNLTSHSAVLWNSNIVIYGGYKHIYGCSGELWMLNLNSYQWKLLYVAKNDTNSSFGKNKGPPPLYKHKAFVSDDEMFVLFGRRSNGTFSDDLWSFHFGSMQWRKRSQSGQIPPNLTDCDVRIIGDVRNHVDVESDYGQGFCCVVGGKDENGDNSCFSYLMSLNDCKWSRVPVVSDAFAVCGAALLSVPSSTCLMIQGGGIPNEGIYGEIKANHSRSSANVGNEAHDDTAKQSRRHVVEPLKVSSQQTDDSEINKRSFLATKQNSTEATTLGLNGLINMPRGSTLFQSIDLLPKSHKVTTFRNSLFDTSNFSNKQQNKTSDDSFNFGGVECSEVSEIENDAVLDSFCSFGSSSLLLRSSSTFSRSVPRLDKFQWSQDPLDPYSLRSSESNTYISMDSLVPILSQNCGNNLLREQQAITENNDGRNDSRHQRFAKRSVQVSDMSTSYKQSGHDNLCYLNDSFDNPLFYHRQRSEVSQGSHFSYQASWDVNTTGTTLLLIGGFDENFIPGRTQGLELSYCHINTGTKTSSKLPPLCNENDSLETRL